MAKEKTDEKEKEEDTEKEEEFVGRYQRSLVAKTTETVIRDLETDEVLDNFLALERILNGIEDLKRALA